MKKLTKRRVVALASFGLAASLLVAAPAQANTVTIKVVTPNYTDAMPAQTTQVECASSVPGQYLPLTNCQCSSSQ